MKSILMLALTVLMVFSFSTQEANAADASDFLRIIGGIVDAADRGRADDGYRTDRRGDRGRVRPGLTCTASDRGWEEHWGGHSSCRSCLQEHGNCVETCSEEYYTCTTQGTDRYGYRQDFTSSGPDRWSTEERSQRQCVRSGYTSCVSRGCDRESQVVSRRGC